MERVNIWISTWLNIFKNSTKGFIADVKIVRYAIIYIKAMSFRLTWNHDELFVVIQRWARATWKVAPLPLLALKSSVATATRYSSTKVVRYRYRYFITKVAALPATLNNM